MDPADGISDELLARVQVIVSALPETTLQSDRFAHTFRIRRSVVAALLAPEDPHGRAVPMIVVRADPVERDVLAAIGHPYFATRHGDRVGVVLDDRTDWEEIRELVTESYRLQAPKKLAALLDDAGADAPG